MLGAESMLLCCPEPSVSLENIEDDSPCSASHGFLSAELDAAAAAFSCDFDGNPHLGLVSSADCREALKAIHAKQGEFMPDGDKIVAHQGEEVYAHRKKVITCMADVCQKLRFADSTFFAAVNILDRFLSVQAVKANEKVLFPLIGTACVSIAAKMSEVFPPKMETLQNFMGENLPFETAHLQRMEMGILNSLEWKMACITPFTALCYIVKLLRDSYECMSREEAKVAYATSMSAMKKFVYSREYVGYSATEIAAASFLRSATCQDQEMCCHDLVMQLNGGRKRSHDGTLVTLCDCMANMTALDPVGPWTAEYPNKRHISRSLSPTTPLGYYL